MLTPVSLSTLENINTWLYRWFHGFLGSTEAQKALKGKPDGTFLIRFSTTNPGSYALTVAYSSTVGHWRISCDKKNYETPTFSIDGR